MSSGSLLSAAGACVSIPKKCGGQRILGVPAVADRVAQLVVKQIVEPAFRPVASYSTPYGDPPKKSALDAVDVTRERCRQHDWVLEFDIRGLLGCRFIMPPGFLNGAAKAE